MGDLSGRDGRRHISAGLGGQTAINLVNSQDERLPSGTTAADIAGMEDREQFDAAMEHLNIPRPRGYTAHNPEAVLDLQ